MKRALLPVACVAAALGLGLGGAAAETISVTSVRPAIVRWAQAATITGGVGSGQANVDVYIDGQTCGDGRWDVISGAHTGPGGGFTAELGAGINLFVRARAGGRRATSCRFNSDPRSRCSNDPGARSG